MTFCPCHCGRSVKPGRTYATRGCYFKANPAYAAARGRKGGAQNAANTVQATLDRVKHLDRDEAIIETARLERLLHVSRDWRARNREKALKGRLGLR